jgi:hypothetical protein
MCRRRRGTEPSRRSNGRAVRVGRLENSRRKRSGLTSQTGGGERNLARVRMFFAFVCRLAELTYESRRSQEPESLNQYQATGRCQGAPKPRNCITLGKPGRQSSQRLDMNGGRAMADPSLFGEQVNRATTAANRSNGAINKPTQRWWDQVDWMEPKTLLSPDR